MNFNDMYFDRDEQFSIGIEEVSGRFYVSIPVSNRMVDYEEYYEIDKDSFDLYLKNPSLALPFIERCRSREMDNLLIVPPGANRGVAK